MYNTVRHSHQPIHRFFSHVSSIPVPRGQLLPFLKNQGHILAPRPENYSEHMSQLDFQRPDHVWQCYHLDLEYPPLWVGIGWQRHCKIRRSLLRLRNQVTLFFCFRFFFAVAMMVGPDHTVRGGELELLSREMIVARDDYTARHSRGSV